MNTGIKTLFVLSLGASLLQPGCAHRNPSGACCASEAKPATAASTKPAAVAVDKAAIVAPKNPPALTNMQDKVGYAIGILVGGDLKRRDFNVNLDQLVQGIKDVQDGHPPRMTDQQARAALTDYQNEKQHEVTAKNLKDGEAFLAANKHKEGIHVHPVTLPDGRTAELQYKILTEGTGEIPRSNDAVRVNYRGTLIDDTEFDSSARHGGQPSRFTVNRVVRGWTEALQMMKAGAKWQLFIPASLAYEERMMPTIPPGSTLVFELELLEIDRPKPLTSDIIRVPSAEEMKAGAKIEMIKAEDVEKMAASQTNQAPADKK